MASLAIVFVLTLQHSFLLLHLVLNYQKHCIQFCIYARKMAMVPNTRSGRLGSRTLTKQGDPRLQLAPLIAPARPIERLPTLGESDLQVLLQAGRGTNRPPTPDDPENQEYYLNGRRISEYSLKDTEGYKTFIMQAPVANEGSAVISRTTASGRSLSYYLEVAQQPKQARACGNGPRCE